MDKAQHAATASREQITAFAADAFQAVGVPEHDARTVAGLMAQADGLGAYAHGIFRLPHYISMIRGGSINPKATVSVLRETAATAVVDGDDGLGHLVMDFAVTLGIAKAREAGTAWIGTVNSNHAGAAGLYTRRAAEEGMAAIYGAVGNANVLPPWGGLEPLLSTNPLSIAVPGAAGEPVVLDMATTAGSFGKIKAAAERGEQIPAGWVVGRDGRDITDPARVGEGFLAPIGGAKGYGLTLMIGLLAGSLNGAAFGRDVVDFNTDHASRTNTGQFLCLVSLDALGGRELIAGRVEQAAEQLRTSEAVPGRGPVRLPGDSSNEKQREAAAGITLPPSLVARLDALAGELGVPTLAAHARTA